MQPASDKRLPFFSAERPRVLVASPASQGGSAVFHREMIEFSGGRFDFLLIEYGSTRVRLPNTRTIPIPYPSYIGWGRYAMSSRSLVLALILELPLAAFSLLASLVWRPRIIIANGLMLSMLLLPATALTGAKMVVSFHSIMAPYKGHGLGRFLSDIREAFDLIVVNSGSTRADLEPVFGSDRILVVPHWANPVFFSDANRERAREQFGVKGRFVVLFVGRMDEAKFCDTLVKAARLLRFDPSITFWFVGSGESNPVLKQEIESLAKSSGNVVLTEYVEDRELMKRIYTAADLVWAYADEDYLARPGVEALACGTPVLVPNLPGVAFKAKMGVPVNPHLVPQGLGWLLDARDASALADLLRTLRTSLPENPQVRIACRAYATQKYSAGNLEPLAARLVGMAAL